MRYNLYMSNYSQNFYNNLKDNHYFASIIKKKNSIYEKDKFIYKNSVIQYNLGQFLYYTVFKIVYTDQLYIQSDGI